MTDNSLMHKIIAMKIMQMKEREDAGDTPHEFIDLMADWMIEYGPDGHCDGHQKIAKLAWEWMKQHPRK